MASYSLYFLPLNPSTVSCRRNAKKYYDKKDVSEPDHAPKENEKKDKKTKKDKKLKKEKK